jgi:hypothetical protein
VFSFSRRKKVAVAVGAAAVATGLILAFGVSSAGAQSVAGQGKPTVPGDNGDVKIHNSMPRTSETDERNEPHVCTFYLDAFNFDSVQSVSWTIEAWAPTGTKGSLVDQGTITLDSSGNGFTTDQTLPNGHYKLFWTFAGEKGAAKHKVFWVSCPAAPPTTPPTSPSCEKDCGSSSSPPPPPSCEKECESPSESPSPTPSAAPAAPAPTPVQTTLPVTG